MLRASVLLLLAALPAAAADLPPDLALVPANAVGFAHVRVAEIWNHDVLADGRMLFRKAGTKAIGKLDDYFTPAPSSVERLTAVAFQGKLERSPATNGIFPGMILTFTAPVDAAKVRAAHLPNAVVKRVAGKEYFADAKQGVAVAFVGDRMLVFGDEDAVAGILGADGKSGPLSAAKEAAAGKHVFAAVNVRALPIPADALQQIPEEYQPLAAATTVSFGVQIRERAELDLRIQYADAAAAEGAEKAMKKLAGYGRVLLNQQRQRIERQLDAPVAAKGGSLPLESFPEMAAAVGLLGAINFADELLDAPPISRDGATLSATAKLPNWMTQYIGASAIAAGVMLPAVQKTRLAAARAQSQNNMKQIGLALHNYHDAYGTFPPAAICDKKGKKLLSWRVAILPFLEQDNLYKQFKLDEPWDSAANKQWSAVNIKTYMDPRAPAKDANQTYYKVFVGNGAMFDWVQGPKIASITDGMSNTIMTIAGGEPTPWAKPDDLEFDPAKELPDYAKAFDGQLLVGMADGSVRMIDTKKKSFTATMLKAFITRAGGEVVQFDD